MRIQNHSVNLDVQGQELEGVKSELASLLEKINKKPLHSEPVPTENKLIDNLCNTIFKQKKKIAQLEADIVGSDLAKRINDAIKTFDKTLKK